MQSTDRRLWTGEYRRLAKWVLDRDGHVCQVRGPRCTQYATEVDHITARADGGQDTPENLRAACKRCNGWLSARRTNTLRYQNTVARYETRL